MVPIVSVIVPAYNTEKYIARAIQSALDQTLKDIEVIVVDDASSDSTVEVINSFQDPRVVKIFNSQNLGAGGARNIALKAATGDWIAVLDSDDWFAPDRLQKLVKAAADHNADMIADDLHFIQDNEKEPWSTLIQESDHLISSPMLIDCKTLVSSSVYGKQGLHLGLSKPLFRRQFLTQFSIKYDESVKVSQDFWLDMDCLQNGARFFLIPQPYYYYRSRPGSLVGNHKIRHLCDDKRKILEFLSKPGVQHQKTELTEIFLDNLKVINQNLAYYRVVEPWKNGDYLTAAKSIVGNSDFFVNLFSRLPGIVMRRVEYHLLGNKLAFEMMNKETSLL